MKITYITILVNYFVVVMVPDQLTLNHYVVFVCTSVHKLILARNVWSMQGTLSIDQFVTWLWPCGTSGDFVFWFWMIWTYHFGSACVWVHRSTTMTMWRPWHFGGHCFCTNTPFFCCCFRSFCSWQISREIPVKISVIMTGNRNTVGIRSDYRSSFLL